MLFALSVPPSNERGPLYAEQALAAIHQGNPGRLPVSLEFARRGDGVSLFCRFPNELCGTVQGQLYAQYPDCRQERVPDDSLNPQSGEECWATELRLSPDLFPIKRYAQFEDALNRLTADPLTAIFTTLAGRREADLRGRIEMVVQPASHRRRHRATKCLHTLARPFFRQHHRLARLYRTLALSHARTLRVLARLLAHAAGPAVAHGPAETLTISSGRFHERELDLQAASDKLGRLLFEVRIRLAVFGPPGRADEAAARLREMAGAFGQFSLPRLASLHPGPGRRHRAWPRRFRSPASLLSAEELATLWHPPTLTVRAPAMTTVGSRELEPPARLPSITKYREVAVLGVTAFRSRRERFGILPDDRLRHVAVLGKTGMGKSTLLHHLLASDIRAGRGAGLIDPHGDLAEAVLRSVPRERTNDVILFDAGDTAFPVAFNVLACPRPEQRPLVASGVVSAFKKLYADSWGPRLEHILRNALLTLLEVPGTTLVSLLRLLSDAGYRRALVARTHDPVVHAFWEREFAGMPPKLRAEAIAPIQNRVGHFVSSPLLRGLVGQAQGRLDLRAVLDQGQVLLINLSKGRVGDDASALLGSLLVTGLQLAAMSRADTPEAERHDFFLYVDEFQNFATESFATVLSEARKYRLALTLANQYLAQLDEATRHAVFGNVGTLAVFQVGAEDAEALAEQLGPDVGTQDLLGLPRGQAYARLLIDGQPSRPFSMRTLPPAPPRRDPGRGEVIRRCSRRRYARPAAAVEEEIRRTLDGPAGTGK